MTGEYEVPMLFDVPGRPVSESGEAPGAGPAAGFVADPDPSDAPAAQPPASAVEPSESMLFLTRLGGDDPDDAQVEAALSDRPSFRRADAEGSLEDVNGAPAMLTSERRVMRRRVGLAFAAIVMLALASLLVDPQGGLFGPAEVLACFDIALRQLAASAVAPSDLLPESDILAAHEAYLRVIGGAGATLVAILGGAAASVGGLLFQSSYRRPFAVAPIVGVAAAVLVGQGIALLVTGSTLGISWLALLVACAVGLAFPVALRFRLNVLNLPDDGARQLGVDATGLRHLADGSAIVLLVASQVAAGPVFPFAIVVPYLARQLFGAEFRCALVGSSLLGAIALLFVRLIPL